MVRYGGTMPSERSPFTPSSILFRPHQLLTRLLKTLKAHKDPLGEQIMRFQTENGQLVEAPGTAPGSEWFIPMSIYRHSEINFATPI